MGEVYQCKLCNREFILDDEPLSKNPYSAKWRDFVPYCPYCGRKSLYGTDGRGSSKYIPAVIYLREND